MNNHGRRSTLKALCPSKYKLQRQVLQVDQLDRGPFFAGQFDDIKEDAVILIVSIITKQLIITSFEFASQFFSQVIKNELLSLQALLNKHDY